MFEQGGGLNLGEDCGFGQNKSLSETAFGPQNTDAANGLKVCIHSDVITSQCLLLCQFFSVGAIKKEKKSIPNL